MYSDDGARPRSTPENSSEIGKAGIYVDYAICADEERRND